MVRHGEAMPANMAQRRVAIFLGKRLGNGHTPRCISGVLMERCRIIGSVVVTAPAALWLWQQGPTKSDHGHGHESHDTKEASDEEPEAESTDEPEEKDEPKDEGDAEEESKDDSKDDGKDESKDEDSSDDSEEK